MFLILESIIKVGIKSPPFPHGIGYGECSSHREQTIASWARQRNALEGRIESGENSCIFFFSIRIGG